MLKLMRTSMKCIQLMAKAEETDAGEEMVEVEGVVVVEVEDVV